MFLFNARFLAFTVVAIFMAVSLFLSMSFGLFGFVVPLFGIASFMLIGHPKRLLVFYWVWVTVADLAAYLMGSPIVKWVAYALAGMMLAVLIIYYIRDRKTLLGDKVMSRVCLILLALATVSAIMNSAPMLGAV